MADNFVANAGSGGSTFAADDISSVLYPRVKVSVGADGSATDCSTTTPLPVALHAASTGGTSIYSLVSAGSTNATNVKSGTGKLHSIVATNVNAAIMYLKIYDTGSTPTAGSGTPVLRIGIPGATTGGGIVWQSSNGMAFASGIGFTLVTGAADNASTGIGASDVLLNLEYK